MAGLISTNIKQDEEYDPLKTVASYEPERINVSPESTVQKQIEGIIAKNSPLMQLAETRGMQSANRRGLLNSSIAVGSAQKEVLGAALPIASQDAATSFAAQQNNQSAGNTEGQFRADQFNQRGVIEGNTAGQSKLLGQRIEGDKALSQQDYMQARGINEQQIEATLQRDILTHQQRLVEAQKSGDIEAARDAAQQLNILDQMSVNFGYTKELNQDNFQQTIERDRLLSQQRLEEARAAGDINAEQMAQAHLNQLDRDEKLFVYQKQLTEQSFQNTLDAMKIEQEYKTDLIKITNENSLLIQQNSIAASYHQQAMVNITNIMNNPDTTTEQKNAAKQQQITMLNEGLALMQSMEDGEYDFSAFTPSSGTTTTGPATGPAEGGMAPGQPTLRPVAGAREVDLTPGKFMGETREVMVRSSGPRGESETKRIQWTEGGWVIIG